jgi:hypothetical protein
MGIYKLLHACIEQEIVKNLFHLELFKFVPKDRVHAL